MSLKKKDVEKEFIKSASSYIPLKKVYCTLNEISEKERMKTLLEINKILYELYKNIPQKERIGKGKVFIARAAASATFHFIIEDNFKKQREKTCRTLEIAFQNIKKDLTLILSSRDLSPSSHVSLYNLLFLSEISASCPYLREEIFSLIKGIISYGNWEFREICVHPIVKALKTPDPITLNWLKQQTHSKDENIRRLVAEALRPRAGNRWMRDPSKNDPIFEILYILRADPSEYVRKSVGNNLKDLSKYIPQKVLLHVEKWIREFIKETPPSLAFSTKKQLGVPLFYLVWTLKHALRWLKERNPELHSDIKKILGEEYLLYYHEKKKKQKKRAKNAN